MLSHNDVHYLTGLLKLALNPKSIEVILGDYLYDDASQEDRDVDISIKYSISDGSEYSLFGYEVKDHKRPLDSTHVEQLCTKLKDIVKISKGGIVSASGYSRPAIKKAIKHGIDLYEFKDWDSDKIEEFKTVRFNSKFLFGEYKPKVKFNKQLFVTHPKLPLLENATLDGSLEVISKDGTKRIELRDFAKNIRNNAISQIKLLDDNEVFDTNLNKVMNLNVKVADESILIYKNNEYRLVEVILEMSVGVETNNQIPHFKILTKLGDPGFKIACALVEISNGNLLGLSISDTQSPVQIINVPVAERRKGKIYKKKIR